MKSLCRHAINEKGCHLKSLNSILVWDRGMCKKRQSSLNYMSVLSFDSAIMGMIIRTIDTIIYSHGLHKECSG